MRTNEEIKEIVEGAFQPLRCAAEIRDFGTQLRFRVFDQNDQSLFACPKLVLRTLQDDSQLVSVIAQARQHIEATGISLMPWDIV